jgi:hypothetical protein
VGDHQSRLGKRALHGAGHPAEAAAADGVDLFDRAHPHGPHGGKGLLAAEKVRNLTIYRSAVTREQAQRGELFYALKHAFNGALTPMVQCLLDTGNLSSDELAELEALIKAKKKGAKKA